MSVGGVHQQGGSGDRVVDAPLEAETASTTAERDRDEVGQQCVWEEELVSQRDAALAMARELSQQLDQQRGTLERRAKTAEALRESAQKAHLECLASRTRQRNQPEVHVRLAALMGGSLSAWLICVVLGLAWDPRAALALGLPCTLMMAAIWSSCVPRLRGTKRRTL